MMKLKVVYFILALIVLALALAAGCGERVSTGGGGGVFGKATQTTTVPTPTPTTEAYPDVTVRIQGPGTGPAQTVTPETTLTPVLKEVYRGIFNLSYATYKHVELDYRLERPPLIITAVFTPKEIKREIVTDSRYGTKEEIRITVGHVTADTKAVITVRDADSGEVLLKDGYRGIYSAEARKEFRVLKAGNLTVEIEGLDVEVDLRMEIYE